MVTCMLCLIIAVPPQRFIHLTMSLLFMDYISGVYVAWHMVDSN